jgi:hypothetical protein
MKRSDTFYHEAIRQVRAGSLVLENGEIFRVVSRGHRHEPRRIDRINDMGYNVFTIRLGPTTQSLCVHRFVWMLTHGEVPAGYVIDHRDNDKQNNRVENLEAVPPAENTARARREITPTEKPSSGSWSSPQLGLFTR